MELNKEGWIVILHRIPVCSLIADMNFNVMVSVMLLLYLLSHLIFLALVSNFHYLLIYSFLSFTSWLHILYYFIRAVLACPWADLIYFKKSSLLLQINYRYAHRVQMYYAVLLYLGPRFKKLFACSIYSG